MNLYKTDYTTISEEDRALWEELQSKEVIYKDGKPTGFRSSCFSQYPKSVKHFLSLFPNNFVLGHDLIELSQQFMEKLVQFRALLDDPNITERNLLNFIRDQEAYFIIGSLLKRNYDFGHHALYLFPEFKMPPDYQADYLIVGKNSAGYHFVFVELENPYGDITIKDGTYGTTIRKGVKQIDDWRIWLEANFSSLILVFDNLKNQNEVLTNEFRKFDSSRIHFAVVAGRRKDYNERTYRLRREHQQNRNLLVVHYDNLIDYAKETIGTPTY